MYSKVKNQYCGYVLTAQQQLEINSLARLEFRKPIALRRLPFQLVEIVKRTQQIQ